MIILQYRVYRQDLRANPSVLYVFGDNEIRQGLGGQAFEMRGEPNAHGIATLSAPCRFWSEADHMRQCGVLATDFAPLFEAANEGRTIILPSDGVGTGLAQLEQRSPNTFAYLQKLWNYLIKKGSK